MIFFLALFFGLGALLLLFAIVVGIIVVVIWLCHLLWQVFKVIFHRGESDG